MPNHVVNLFRLFKLLKSGVSAYQSRAGKAKADKALPRLYPNIDSVEFPLFRSTAESEKIKKFPLLMVLPFTDAAANEKELLFGTGFARLLIRNLMLAKNISVTGPEDTHKVGLEELKQHLPRLNNKKILIGGGVELGNQKVTVHLKLMTPTGKEVAKTVTSPDGRTALRQCSEVVCKVMRSEVDDKIRKMWGFGQPVDDFEENVCRLAALQLAYDSNPEDPETAHQAYDLLQRAPGMGSACAYIDSDVMPNAKQICYETLQKDPYDAQLCFTLFLSHWESTGNYEPYAVQFIRKGLELSPAHGKMNMCAPHAVDSSVRLKMLHHSELGYLLLPGNSFAINNYLSNLSATNAPFESYMKLADEAMDADPHDPGTLERIFYLLRDKKDYQSALSVGMLLEELYREMHSRTLYCIKQNPQRSKMVEEGFDFAGDMRGQIEELQKIIESQ